MISYCHKQRDMVKRIADELKMEEFTPQAWFQMHMGSRKYYKFIDDDSFTENIGRLIKIIKEAAARQKLIGIIDEVTLNQILDNPHYQGEVRATVLAERPVQKQTRKLLELKESSELKSNRFIEIFFEVNSDLASEVGLKKAGPLMISYCHKQRDMVKRIADELKTRGIQVWIDDSIQEDLTQEISKAITNAWAVIVCFSKAYEESRWCKKEIEFAAHSNKRMFFLKMEEFTPQAWFQMHMGSRKYYKFIDDDSFTENIGRLIKIIKEADKRLFEVRTKFIEGVNVAIIQDLLDDMQHVKVLNDGEVEDVKEGQTRTKDKARCLIDMIYKIQDKASRQRLALIINNIEFEKAELKRNGAQQDQEQMKKLLEELGYSVELYNDQSAQEMESTLSLFSQREEHTKSDSTFVVLMSHGVRDGICGKLSKDEKTDILKTDKIFDIFNTKNCAGLRGKPKIYKIQDKASRQRLALIINNIEFEKAELKRNGAQQDQEQMKKLLEELGYSVELYNDQSAKEMESTLSLFSQREEHTKSDSTFVVLMSHGFRDGICGKLTKDEKTDILKTIML
ncbi:UNVERIFIED_CONTAM: hypothetical protein FKN15_075664 [Acipenser sinensis]